MSAITPRASGTSTDGSSCALDVRERPLIEISGKAARGTSIWHAHSDPARANSMGGDIDFLQLLSAQPEVGARLRSDQLVLIDIALQIGRQGSTVLRDRVSSSRPRTVRARRCHATRIAAQESKPLAHQNDLVLCAVARDRTVGLGIAAILKSAAEGDGGIGLTLLLVTGVAGVVGGLAALVKPERAQAQTPALAAIPSPARIAA